jgi:heme oxygenase
MTTIKELTWDAHKRAESTRIMTDLLNNTITDCMYSDLVYTKYLIYSELERKLSFQTACLPRAAAALSDWQNMNHSMPRCLTTLEHYLAMLRTMHERQLWAHAYVHYLAPLYGGQIIRKRIAHRFPVSIYEFDDAASAIAEIRSHVTVDMAPDANQAFDLTADYYEQLYQSGSQS